MGRQLTDFQSFKILRNLSEKFVIPRVTVAYFLTVAPLVGRKFKSLCKTRGMGISPSDYGRIGAERQEKKLQ
jgi:hypothetical protein